MVLSQCERKRESRAAFVKWLHKDTSDNGNISRHDATVCESEKKMWWQVEASNLAILG